MAMRTERDTRSKERKREKTQREEGGVRRNRKKEREQVEYSILTATRWLLISGRGMSLFFFSLTMTIYLTQLFTDKHRCAL